ncbi:MAG: transposase [Akkermansia sp.]|nr:transposase [Akkermansia sp.]
MSVTTNADNTSIFNCLIIKSGGVPMEENHFPRIFDYIGGTIRSMSGISFIVGGRSDHIHILCSAPVSISLSDFVRGIKATPPGF